MLHRSIKFACLIVQLGCFLFLSHCKTLSYKSVHSKLNTSSVPTRVASEYLRSEEPKKKTIQSHAIIESQELTPFLALTTQNTKKGNSFADNESDEEFDNEFADEFAEETVDIYDPWESMNRVVFSFNEFFFLYGLSPLARANAFLLPKSLRLGINNALENLGMPVRMLSALFQGKVVKASLELSNFIINSTLGIGGLFNASRDWFGIHINKEDFGQTLAVWGIPPGPHLELPFIGTSNMRDAFGFGLDSIFSPRGWLISYLLLPGLFGVPSADLFRESVAVNLGIFVFKIINQVSLRLGEYEELRKNAIDPYSLFKTIYERRREKLIKE